MGYIDLITQRDSKLSLLRTVSLTKTRRQPVNLSAALIMLTGSFIEESRQLEAFQRIYGEFAAEGMINSEAYEATFNRLLAIVTDRNGVCWVLELNAEKSRSESSYGATCRLFRSWNKYCFLSRDKNMLHEWVSN